MYKLSQRVNSKLIKRHNKIVFGYDIWSGRKTACIYLYNKHKTGLIFDNTPPHTLPVFEYNIETMIQDMNRIFPNEHIYIAGVQDEEQFALFKRLGFIMVKINRPIVKPIRKTKWDFLRQDMLGVVHDGIWDVVINNNGSLEDFYQKLDKIRDNS